MISREYLYRLIVIITVYSCLFGYFLENNEVNASCTGKVIDPVSDVCWSCIFPITIGKMPLGNDSEYKDTSNPDSPLCFCDHENIPLAPGVSIGFWEPIRIVEVVRAPYCLVSLGGVQVMQGMSYATHRQIRADGDKRSKAFYHVHAYLYSPLYLLNLINDFKSCMETEGYKVAYMSEFDPAHTNENLANFMNPEAFLLSNVSAINACQVDCKASNISKQSMESLFWCSGCQGSVYPLSGYTSNHIGAVATSQLLVTRQLTKMHHQGQGKRSATNSSKPNGEICKADYVSRLPKNQYRTQIVYPVVGKCNNIGRSDVFYSSGMEFPHKAEDFVYLIFRKRNCCLVL